ncbi:hypothetical protein [Marinomonas transparens]|uniref:Uncharacterized protein n=1 Tax=Marinomonas transparens TaxID=2795388 RepID=A0A934JNS3_9GAMM|nr:hypothetical protein [Marinomonas transparens]MBJ7536943.1 hypothetical protein [Marinomonas transparens]
MRGKVKIINTNIDLEASQMTREQIIAAATIMVRYDDAEYPEGYEKNLKEGEDGYIEPVYRFEQEIDLGALDRFGVVLS